MTAKEKLRGTTALMWAAEQGHPETVKALITARRGCASAATNNDTKGARGHTWLPRWFKDRNSAGKALADWAKAVVVVVAAPGLEALVTEPLARLLRLVMPPRLQIWARPALTPPLPLEGLVVAEAEVVWRWTRPGRSRSRCAGAAAGADGEVDVAAADEAAAQASFGRQSDSDGGGLTPLVFAARQDCLECAKELIAAGANVNQVTHYGWTPLLTATQNRHYKVASFLLEKGANPNISNNGGWSPLYIATDNRNIEGGDYPARKPDMDHLDFIRNLIDKGANDNVRVCGTRSTPTYCAGDSTETRTNFTMQWLQEDGATPFLRAAQSGDVELMKLLLMHGA